jgi:hypothetical protein
MEGTYRTEIADTKFAIFSTTLIFLVVSVFGSLIFKYKIEEEKMLKGSEEKRRRRKCFRSSFHDSFFCILLSDENL